MGVASSHDPIAVRRGGLPQKKSSFSRKRSIGRLSWFTWAVKTRLTLLCRSRWCAWRAAGNLVPSLTYLHSLLDSVGYFWSLCSEIL